VTVRLSAGGDRRRAACAVSDTGVGIEPHLLSQVFDLFAQADRTRHRTPGGLGLGLALVKALVELHGGGVTAASRGPGRRAGGPRPVAEAPGERAGAGAGAEASQAGLCLFSWRNLARWG